MTKPLWPVLATLVACAGDLDDPTLTLADSDLDTAVGAVDTAEPSEPSDPDTPVVAACETPVTMAPMGDFGTIWMCNAENPAWCTITNGDDPMSADGPCAPGAASFFFARSVSGSGVFTTITANGWVVDSHSHGNPIANASVNDLPYDTDILITGAGGGITYEVMFSASEDPSELTITSLDRR